MRNKRTGKTAVYDETIVAQGSWEPVEAQTTSKSPTADQVKAGDTVEISVKKSNGESVKRKA
jgi:hypothetical protein